MDMVLHRGVARGCPPTTADSTVNCHDVVNDRHGDEAVVITYGPRCGTGGRIRCDGGRPPACVGRFRPALQQRRAALRSQERIALAAAVRPGDQREGAGKDADLLPVTHTSWSGWRQLHPQSPLVSPASGKPRPYERNSYAGWADSRELYFPVGLPIAFRRGGLHSKECVPGCKVGGVAKAMGCSATPSVARQLPFCASTPRTRKLPRMAGKARNCRRSLATGSPDMPSIRPR